MVASLSVAPGQIPAARSFLLLRSVKMQNGAEQCFGTPGAHRRGGRPPAPRAVRGQPWRGAGGASGGRASGLVRDVAAAVQLHSKTVRWHLDELTEAGVVTRTFATVAEAELASSVLTFLGAGSFFVCEEIQGVARQSVRRRSLSHDRSQSVRRKTRMMTTRQFLTVAALTGAAALAAFAALLWIGQTQLAIVPVGVESVLLMFLNMSRRG